jgi:hypothetical protein
MKMSPKLSAAVQRLIDELDPARAEEPRARACKENLNALPLHYDENAVWALRPDGTLLRLGREATGHSPEPESDPVRIYQALVRAAHRYPELCEVVPAAQLAMTPLAYPCKSSALTADELRRAIAEGRVLLVDQGPRVMGDSDVYYRVAGPEDLDSWGLPKQGGIVFEEPVTGGDLDDLASRGYDWAWEAWNFLLNPVQHPAPALPLTAEDRAKLERAETLFDAQLLELLPHEATGLEELDRDVVAAIASSLLAVVGDDYASFVDDAARWLGETRRAWRERAEWEIATGGEPSIPVFTDDEIPAIIRVHRTPPLERQPPPAAPAAPSEPEPEPEPEPVREPDSGAVFDPAHFQKRFRDVVFVLDADAMRRALAGLVEEFGEARMIPAMAEHVAGRGYALRQLLDIVRETRPTSSVGRVARAAVIDGSGPMAIPIVRRMAESGALSTPLLELAMDIVAASRRDGEPSPRMRAVAEEEHPRWAALVGRLGESDLARRLLDELRALGSGSTGRPEGAKLCDACGVTGLGADPLPTCPVCREAGWYRWALSKLENVDQGYYLVMRAVTGGPALHAARIAGLYVAKEGDAFWSAPAGPEGRHALWERLAEFHPAVQVDARWVYNEYSEADPFESPDLALRFRDEGRGAPWAVEVARQESGRYVKSARPTFDWKSLGGWLPAADAEEIDEATARAEVVRMIRESRSESPFPVVVKRPRGPNERHLACRICSQLRDEECATDYLHAPEDNTSLPAAARELKSAGGAGRSSLERCPECGTYYLYNHHYEFLLISPGSYDEYTLTRLTDERAAEYLEGRDD